MTEKIPIFLSVGEPHNDVQKQYLDEIIQYFSNNNISAETLGRTFWSIKNPLEPIQNKMTHVHGACILAMERFQSLNGCYKRGSEHESLKNVQYFASIWTQLEAAMAYQEELPLLIFKEENLVAEGMFDGQIHGWMVVRINPENPSEINQGPIKKYIDSWIEEVRCHYYCNL